MNALAVVSRWAFLIPILLEKSTFTSSIKSHYLNRTKSSNYCCTLKYWLKPKPLPPKTAVSVSDGFQKNRGFRFRFGNRHNTSYYSSIHVDDVAVAYYHKLLKCPVARQIVEMATRIDRQFLATSDPIRLISIESSFHPCNIYRDCPRGDQNLPNRRIWHIAASISLLIYYTAIYIPLENK